MHAQSDFFTVSLGGLSHGNEGPKRFTPDKPESVVQ